MENKEEKAMNEPSARTVLIPACCGKIRVCKMTPNSPGMHSGGKLVIQPGVGHSGWETIIRMGARHSG